MELGQQLPNNLARIAPLHITRGLCAYLDDLMPFACVARGLVTEAGWRAHCESCWPEWSLLLPGSARQRARALRAPLSEIEQPLRWIDPALVCPRQCENLVLLELLHAGAVLWRATSKVYVHQPTYNFHGHSLVEEAEFTMPASVANVIDAELVHWWRRPGLAWPPPDYIPAGLSSIRNVAECDIECWLQVWVLDVPAVPIVLRPSLSLNHIRWEVTAPSGKAISELHFSQNFVGPVDGGGNDLYGSIELQIFLYRQEYQAQGMDAPFEATVSLQGVVDEHASFLFSGYLSKMFNVHA